MDILRHCQSIFNANPKSLLKNCSLTQKGYQQASNLSGHYDLVICSTMRRTKETLNYSLITYDNIVYTNLCREYKKDICDYFEYEDITGEDEDELMDRVIKFYEICQKFKKEYDKILVVSHRDFLYALTKEVCGSGVNLDNGELFTIEHL